MAKMIPRWTKKEDDILLAYIDSVEDKYGSLMKSIAAAAVELHRNPPACYARYKILRRGGGALPRVQQSCREAEKPQQGPEYGLIVEDDPLLFRLRIIHGNDTVNRDVRETARDRDKFQIRSL